MRGAPSVDYPVGRSLWGGFFLLALWIAGAAVLLAWSIQAPLGGRQACDAVAHVAAGVAALRSWLKSKTGQLAWDGHGWRLQEKGRVDAQQLRLEVVLDFQKMLLLRGAGVDAPARTWWFWMERASAPARWLALRRAVYSPAAAESQPPGEPAADP